MDSRTGIIAPVLQIRISSLRPESLPRWILMNTLWALFLPPAPQGSSQPLFPSFMEAEWVSQALQWGEPCLAGR